MCTDTHTRTHTHIRTDIFSKPLFWTQGTSKRIFPLKSQSRIFLPSQYFPYTYCIWEKVKTKTFLEGSGGIKLRLILQSCSMLRNHTTRRITVQEASQSSKEATSAEI